MVYELVGVKYIIDYKNITQERLTKYSNRLCKCCGKSIFWYNTKVTFNRRDRKYKISGRCEYTEKKVNGITYKLNVCERCMDKEFEIKNKSKLFNTFGKTVEFAFDVPHDELKKDAKNKHAITQEHLIKKYGAKEGYNRYNSYLRNQSRTQSFKYKKETYGWTHEDFKNYNKSKSNTLNNMVKKHGEIDGYKKWEEYKLKQSYRGIGKDYFISKYGRTNGLDEYHKIKKINSYNINQYIKKYGHKEGVDIYKVDIRDNISEQLYSIDSQNLFWEIVKYNNNTDYMFTENKGNYFIYNKTNKHYYTTDFYDPETKKTIEFRESVDSTINSDRNVTRISDIWIRKDVRDKVIKSNKIISDVIVVWKHKWIEDKTNILNKCIEFLER
jgi:hypothetical protein